MRNGWRRQSVFDTLMSTYDKIQISPISPSSALFPSPPLPSPHSVFCPFLCPPFSISFPAHLASLSISLPPSEPTTSHHLHLFIPAALSIHFFILLSLSLLNFPADYNRHSHCSVAKSMWTLHPLIFFFFLHSHHRTLALNCC